MNIKTTTLLLLLYSDYNNRRCGVVILIEIEAHHWQMIVGAIQKQKILSVSGVHKHNPKIKIFFI